MIVIFNPDCSKCKSAVELLDNSSCEYSLRNYLEQPLSVEELEDLCSKLNLKPSELIRPSEAIYTEHFASKQMSEMDLLRAMADFPVLIERPIVISGSRAVIGRPAVRVLDLILT